MLAAWRSDYVAREISQSERIGGERFGCFAFHAFTLIMLAAEVKRKLSLNIENLSEALAAGYHLPRVRLFACA